jgi:hypothetical protein
MKKGGYSPILNALFFRDLFLDPDGFYRTIFNRFFAGPGYILWNLVPLDFGFIIGHLKDLWTGLCTKSTSDTGLFINDHSHLPILLLTGKYSLLLVASFIS